ncbi:PfkB family carbohydrate kinase [Spiroplasma apis]|uniref:2-dehydro-3-deoxygluconokinase n=1 Tax=Spiroplasma apis B31 TaxID=1276258 RepID=V5RHW9_SPIAP|nr:PfkB family carbohydrate kinase [Spiroplasma apis]AHB36282.1 2-dehydro-3-deoxygluconokinase [Spiroplasma apis B31]
MRILVVGETLLRLTSLPNKEFSNNELVTINFGGAEFNVANYLGIWGNEVTFLTKLSNDFIGASILNFLKTNNVITKNISLDNYKPLGTYYVKKGLGPFNDEIIYNRSSSCFTEWLLTNNQIEDLSNTFDCIYISGISFATNINTRLSLIKLVKTFSKKNKKIFFDFNYRSKLWNYEEARKTYLEILPLSTYISMGIKDLVYILKLLDSDSNYDESLVKGYQVITKKYPNIEKIYSTKREIITSNSSRVTGYLWENDVMTKSDTIFIDNYVERIGTGDAFSASIVHSILMDLKNNDILRNGLSCLYFKHYLLGDWSKISFKLIKEWKFINSDIKR